MRKIKISAILLVFTFAISEYATPTEGKSMRAIDSIVYSEVSSK